MGTGMRRADPVGHFLERLFLSDDYSFPLRKNTGSEKQEVYPVRRIAMEEAFWVDGLVTPGTPSSHQGSVYRAEVLTRWATRLTDFTDYRLPEMDAHGIDMQVLSLTSPGLQMQPDARVAVEDARRANDALAEIIANQPTRFSGLAALPLQDPDTAAGELRRAVVDLRLPGALVNDHTLGEYLDAPRFGVVWAALEELGVPLYIHPSGRPPDQWHVLDGRPELSGPSFSWAAATAGHALRLIYGGVFDRFPSTTVILGHMGEFLPFQLARLDARHVDLDLENGLKKLPSQYFLDNFAITTSGVCSHAALLGVVLEIGIKNVLFAVDYPYESTADAVQFLDSAPLAEADLAQIAHGNAERILRMQTTEI
jgi:2,3-dihydroxybenzoate decarboxylase